MGVRESLSWSSEWRISKFRDADGRIAEMLRNGAKIEDVVEKYPKRFIVTERIEGNVGLKEGRAELIDIICGLGTPIKWDSGNAYLGVGDNDLEANENQTGLQAEVNKSWMPMDGTYPQRANQTAKWRATWGSVDGNYAWKEYTVVNGADDTGKNLNRCVADKGTKVEGETWTLELQITFNAT